MALGQLFGFEEMPSLIEDWNIIPTDLAWLTAALLAIVQVAALPALLSMPLTPAVRLVSSISGWIALIVWLGIAVLLLIGGQSGINTGLFGSHVHTPAGLWVVGFVTLLLVMRIVASIEYRRR